MGVALPVAGEATPDADIPELTGYRAYGARLRPLFLASTRYLAYSELLPLRSSGALSPTDRDVVTAASECVNLLPLSGLSSPSANYCLLNSVGEAFRPIASTFHVPLA